MILSSGIFLSLVLYAYKAFGIDQGVSFSGHSLLTRAVLFGAGVSVAYAFNEIVIRPYLNFKIKWQLGCWVVWEIFIAAQITFLLFNVFWNWTEFNLSTYTLLMREFVSVMLVPHLLAFIFSKQKIKAKDHLIVLEASNKKDRFQFQLHDLILIKSEDNYIQVFTRQGDKVHTKLIRQSITQAEKQLATFEGVIRVHRSYMVNKQAIRSKEQNGKQLILHMDGNRTIKVSTKYVVNVV